MIHFSCESIPAAYHDSPQLNKHSDTQNHTNSQSNGKLQSIVQSDDDDRLRSMNQGNHRNGSIHSNNIEISEKNSLNPKNNQSNHRNGSIHQSNHKNGSVHYDKLPNGKKHSQTNGHVKSIKNTSEMSEV